MKKETTKKRKIDKKRWIVSIVALVLAALMVAGVAYYAIVMIRYERERKRIEEEILSQIGDGHEGHDHD